ncbi:MAG TPA: class I SAM-dependent methyltransferase [Candidatus Angelobacter sp.]
MTTMADRIDDNLSLISSSEAVDQINGSFYSRFPFPWRPKSLDCTSDPDFARVMCNQNLGDWTHHRVPANPHIWVAGCGTNQAAITALHFPNAAVLGSDVSTSSLELCASTARDLGSTNLELRNESINQAGYRGQFDYIICTGVIHHNADPEVTLTKLANALKPAGVLELMVYNRYHRILTSAFQRGVRLLAGTEGRPDFQKELSITRSLLDSYPGEGLMQVLVNQHKHAPEAQIADSLMQPVENSYTIETLEDMVARCGLELVAPSPNAWDTGTRNTTWNLRFSQDDIQRSYDAFPDSRRWQITNLLLCENSPMLWFYVQRTDSPVKKRTEQEICEAFLETRFRSNAVTRHSYMLNADNRFTQASSPALPYPGIPIKPELRKIIEKVNSGITMNRALASLGIARDFATVNSLRFRLTTSVSPFLRAIP